MISPTVTLIRREDSSARALNPKELQERAVYRQSIESNAVRTCRAVFCLPAKATALRMFTSFICAFFYASARITQIEFCDWLEYREPSLR